MIVTTLIVTAATMFTMQGNILILGCLKQVHGLLLVLKQALLLAHIKLNTGTATSMNVFPLGLYKDK